MNTIKSSRSYSIILLALIYLVVRFAFTAQLDSLGIYSAYIFEVVCVTIAVILTGKSFLSGLSLKKLAIYCAPISIAAGFGIYKAAAPMGILIPFDFNGLEPLLFLLVVAPILEESIFRFYLWRPIQMITRSPLITLLLTSLIFSYSHLHAIWFVAPEIKDFVIYQTTYTLALGLACGFFVYKYASLTSAVLIHFAFNLGFYIASIV